MNLAILSFSAMRLFRKTKEALEYHGARIAFWAIRRLPPAAACRFAKGLADLAFLVLAKRRRTAVENLLAGGVAANRREARRIARASFESMALTVAESFLVTPLLTDPQKRDAMIDFEIPAVTREVLEAPGKGAILVSGHLGNWEFGAQFVSQFKPVTGVARPMKNARVQSLMDEVQMRGNFETIDKHSLHPMQLVRALKKGRVLALLTDQHATGDSAAIVQFFGRPAATYTSPAVLQRLTGAPILFATGVRNGFLHYRAYISEPIFYPYRKDHLEEDIQAATQDIASRLEAEIRKTPEQYLWAHRRWKVRKQETPAPLGSAARGGDR